MNIPYTPAKSISVGGIRSYSSIKYIIIHYTGISGDSAENEVKFFATGNQRTAGAHFFVGQDGHICQSIKMSQTAKSVPQKRQAYTGGGTYLKKCTSGNSVSIELCDNLTKDPSPAQTEAVRQLVAYIQSICPNAQTFVRHYDVTGKLCPGRMTDCWTADTKKWQAFKAAITKKEEVEDLTKDETQKLIDESITKAVKQMKDYITELISGKDLPPSQWAVDEGVIEAGQEAGITDGSRPQGLAKREEVIGMIIRNNKRAGGDSD